MSDPKFASFSDFWPFYLGEHRHPMNRTLHYIASTSAIAGLLLFALTLKPLILLLTPVAAYFWAWIGHFFIESNQPATFKHPLWSLRGDFKMFFIFLRGQLPAEFAKQGLDPNLPR